MKLRKNTKNKNNTKKEDISLNSLSYTFLSIFKEMFVLLLGYLVTLSYFLNKLDIDKLVQDIKINIQNEDNRFNFDSFADIAHIRDSIKLIYYSFLKKTFTEDNKIGILFFYFILILFTQVFYYATYPVYKSKTKNDYKELLYSFIVKTSGVLVLPLLLFSLFLYIIIIINSITFILENLKFDISYIIVPLFFFILYLSWGLLFYFYTDNFFNDLKRFKIDYTNIIVIIVLLFVILIDYLLFYDKTSSFICSSLTFFNEKVLTYFINIIIENKKSIFSFPYMFTLIITLYIVYTIWTRHNLYYIPLLLLISSLFIIIYSLYS